MVSGSTVALTDSTGTAQTQYTYEPFGNTTVTGPANGNPFQYTARENDATGLLLLPGPILLANHLNRLARMVSAYFSLALCCGKEYALSDVGEPAATPGLMASDKASGPVGQLTTGASLKPSIADSPPASAAAALLCYRRQRCDRL